MNYRLLFVIAALVLGGAGLAVWQRQSQATPLPRPYQPQGAGSLYLALGDSLATGFRLADPQRENYVAVLSSRLSAQGTNDYVNLGIAGATSGSLIERQLPRALELLRQAEAEGQRVSPITIDIGGNDLRSVENAGEAEREALVRQVGSNLATIFKELRQVARDSDIAVMTYYNPYGGDPSIAGSDAYWVERLNAEIRHQAGLHGIAVAEVYQAFDEGRAYEYTNILLGDIHANSRGHAVIAEQFWQALGYEQ